MNVNKDLRILSLLQIFQDASLTNKNTVFFRSFHVGKVYFILFLDLSHYFMLNLSMGACLLMRVYQEYIAHSICFAMWSIFQMAKHSLSMSAKTNFFLQAYS